VNRKNAVAFEEQAMNRLIKERHCLQEQLARLSAQSACTMDLKLRADILEEQDALQTKLNYVQGEILKYQKNIVELEDQVVEVKNFLKYIIGHFNNGKLNKKLASDWVLSKI